MGIIKPTVGRVVLYYPAASERIDGQPNDQPLKADITYVWNDRMVNLMAVTPNGTPFGVTSVDLVQDDAATPIERYCTWMPYQLGQAAKTEAVQKSAADASEHPMGKLVLAVSNILRTSYPHLDDLHAAASGNHANDPKTPPAGT